MITSSKSSHSAVMCYLLDKAEGVEHECAPCREEGGAGEFKAGAFRIAVKTSAPVVPVAVTGARALFETNGNRCRPGSVRIKIMSPIQTAGMSKAEQKQLPDAVRQSILAALK